MQINTMGDLYSQDTAPPAPKELDRDAFMQLLVSQLKNQDPLEPVQNEDFVAQLATFSSLEQLEGVNDGMTGLLLLEQAGQITSQLSEGASLIDKQVGWTDPSSGLSGSGVVESVKVVDDLTTVTVNGQDVPLYWVDEIQPASDGSADTVDDDAASGDDTNADDDSTDEQA